MSQLERTIKIIPCREFNGETTKTVRISVTKPKLGPPAHVQQSQCTHSKMWRREVRQASSLGQPVLKKPTLLKAGFRQEFFKGQARRGWRRWSQGL